MPTFFTKENAVEMVKRSHANRKARLEKLQADSNQLNALHSTFLAAIPNIPEQTGQAGRVAAQLNRIEGMIACSTSADELNKLTSAFDRLFKAWQVLTGTQNPGVRKGGKRQAAAPIAPIESPAPDKPCPTPIADAIQPTGPKSEDCTG